MSETKQTAVNSKNKSQNIKIIAICAVMLALATVLSIFPKIEWFLGGSITVGSMVPIMLISFLYGPKWGIPMSIGYSIIQLLLGVSRVASWGLTPGVFVGCLLLDYIFAFSSLCVCGFFKTDRIGTVIAGTVVAGLLRFLCHFLSGYLFFGSWAMEGFNAFTWAIVYNRTYMVPETTTCVIIICVLYRFFPKFRSI